MATRPLNSGTSTMHGLTGFQRDCLAAIEQRGSPHGLGIKEELDEMYAERVNHGRLYPNLDTLVEAGLVEKAQKDGRTNTYSLTDEGRARLAEHVSWLGSCL